MKAGFLPKQHEAAVSKVSAWAEGLGYIANISLSLHKLQQLNLQEQLLLRKVQDHCKVRLDSSRGQQQEEGAAAALVVGLVATSFCSVGCC